MNLLTLFRVIDIRRSRCLLSLNSLGGSAALFFSLKSSTCTLPQAGDFFDAV